MRKLYMFYHQGCVIEERTDVKRLRMQEMNIIISSIFFSAKWCVLSGLSLSKKDTGARINGMRDELEHMFSFENTSSRELIDIRLLNNLKNFTHPFFDVLIHSNGAVHAKRLINGTTFSIQVLKNESERWF